jgi:hypothetical protein
VPLSSLITLIASMCWLAGSALVAWVLVSRSTRQRKRPESPPPTPPSEGHLARLEADQAELFSTLEKLSTTVKRLSSRAGMQDVRARSGRDEPPPVGTDKATLLRHYGMSGKIGPEFARAQQDIELRRPN